MKSMAPEEKKELLLLRLEEIRRNKENIIKQIAENYKDMAEKEKFMDKIKKMANEAAIKIQKFWRRQLMRLKAQRGIVQSCAIERQYQIIKSATEKLLKLTNFVQQHRDKITNVILKDSHNGLEHNHNTKKCKKIPCKTQV
jgi:IQ calmodulin-binding motif